MIDLTDEEALAAEYVLGTLDGNERAEAERRRASEAAFDILVTAWEARLAPLDEVTPSLAPPDDLFARLAARLPANDAGTHANDNILILRRQIRTWRRAAAVASAMAAVLALWIVGREVAPSTTSDHTYVAVLQHGADQPSFVVSLDLATRKMTVMPLAVSAPVGKSYELWMIGENAAPRSMGVMDKQAPIRPNLPDVDKGVISNATYAVTLEPQGGSPTGQPTSAPMFVGKLINTAL